MFLRRFKIERISEQSETAPVPIAQIDNFCMRNFTNNAIFDDTLPIADGLLEAGNLVPLESLQTSMEAWFRRKNYLTPIETLRITELQIPVKPPQGLT